MLNYYVLKKTKKMNPKNDDKAGKAILAAASAAITYVVQKYGPKVAKKIREVLTKRF